MSAELTEVMDVPVDAEQGYEMVSRLIFDQVHKFVRTYGGDFDDLLGEAHVAFVKGHNQFLVGYNPSGTKIKHSYATEIRRWVWFELFDAMRIRMGRKSKNLFVPLEDHDYHIGTTEADFDINDFVEKLSDDGVAAAWLVLNPFHSLAEEIEGKGGTPRNYRSCVRSHLRGMGWTPARINEAFDEIKRVLG